VAGGVALSSAVLLGVPASRAAPIGTLVFDPATGTNDSTVTVTTSGPCTAPNATSLQAKLFGAGFPAGGQVVVANSPLSAYPVTPAGGYIVPLGDTLQGFANLQSPPATLSGRYDVVLTCRTNVSQASLGDFTGSIWFTSPTQYQNTDPAPTTTATPTPPPTTTTSPPPGNGSAGQAVGVVIPSHPTSSSSHPGEGGGGGGGGGGGSGGGGGGGGGESADGGSAGGGGGLAHTGLPLAELVVAAAVLVVTGGALTRRGRRRQPGGRLW
jgi:hypothetical protein